MTTPTPLVCTVQQAADRLGEPFTVKYLYEHLRPGGLFHGLGARKNNRPSGTWIIRADRLDEFVERQFAADRDRSQPLQQLQPVTPTLGSGVSPRSPRVRGRVPA